MRLLASNQKRLAHLLGGFFVVWGIYSNFANPSTLLNWLKGEHMNNFDIKEWRLKLGIIPEKTADLLGVSINKYNEWEIGGSPIPIPVVEACYDFSARYAGVVRQGGLHYQIEKYKEAYRLYHGCKPTGKHLIYTPWKTIHYKLIDLTPNNN